MTRISILAMLQARHDLHHAVFEICHSESWGITYKHLVREEPTHWFCLPNNHPPWLNNTTTFPSFTYCVSLIFLLLQIITNLVVKQMYPLTVLETLSPKRSQ